MGAKGKGHGRMEGRKCVREGGIRGMRGWGHGHMVPAGAREHGCMAGWGHVANQHKSNLPTRVLRMRSRLKGIGDWHGNSLPRLPGQTIISYAAYPCTHTLCQCFAGAIPPYTVPIIQ